ncbi:MAG TPA: tetratricopeptide repeat protein [Allosphingosinicella sp.]|uniref:tetratricopeptide repeat protein n=1 Tax=Allosphingosinicella sp. TaxID=2823234 RepID=UPI002ED98429
MKLGKRAAFCAALFVGAATFAGQSATAQQGRTFTLNAQERAAILPLQNAILTNNFAAAAAALPAARSAAQGADARYMVGQYQLRTGIATANLQMQAHAIEIMLSSGVVPAADLPQLVANQAALAIRNNDIKRAEAAYARYVELAPNDANAVMALAEIRHDMGNVAASVPLMERAIDLRQASGQPVPESWYKRALKTAFDAKVAPQSLKFSRALVATYPSDENIRDAALVHRDLGGFDNDARLDLYRLLRASKSMAGERDYFESAQAFTAAGLGNEAKSVLDEGVSQRMVDASKGAAKDLLAASAKRATGKAALTGLQTKAMASATGTAALSAGDTFFGSGDYAAAASLYQAALQKGSVDPNVANTRLGIALAMAGQRAEAETAFRAVTGPRANLASLWLAWLSRRA